METDHRIAKRRVDRWSVLFVMIMLASWITAVWFLSLAMGGGFLGIFLNWCLGILLLVPIGFLLRELIVRGPQTAVRLSIGIFALIGLVPLSLWQIGSLVTTWHSNPVHDLKGLPPGSGFTRTRYEFRKDASHFIIHDPANRLRFCYGARPAAIRLEGEERVVVFEDWVILKSWTFDYGFEGGAINFGGWMGASSSEPELSIGPDGMPLPKQ